LLEYFNNKIGNELIAFVARENKRIVSVVFLHIMEMPANLNLPNGLFGEVLNVYTEQEYRGKGLCTQLMQNLINFGRKRGLGRIDLSATPKGYPIYAKLGFVDKNHKYKDMRLNLQL